MSVNWVVERSKIDSAIPTQLYMIIALCDTLYKRSKSRTPKVYGARVDIIVRFSIRRCCHWPAFPGSSGRRSAASNGSLSALRHTSPYCLPVKHVSSSPAR